MNTTSQDAIVLLKADHQEAKELFDKYENIKEHAGDDQKMEIAKKVCGALLIHMEIEEKIFYPRVRQKIDDADLMNEALVEHDGAKSLIQQIGELKPGDPMFDAKIKVLGEQIEHHVEEEEKEMFPKARDSGLDLIELGSQLFEAKNRLRVEHGLPALSTTSPTKTDTGSAPETTQAQVKAEKFSTKHSDEKFEFPKGQDAREIR
ncbi:hemerythrin domain-containing protein [Herbaspirillum lusitanum]|uniref:hemerythrin domain-containing protein n=1 Tax=Herbaspirillum lusitanum TaxID=213312 RepID=UPI002237A9B8|nr:hemerythrin domain-containing protein [Herbaspirillum lusitanum]MCW5298909.1 hemerythrin domain-containing protein [Herbaspirillum lusitanum]